MTLGVKCANIINNGECDMNIDVDFDNSLDNSFKDDEVKKNGNNIFFKILITILCIIFGCVLFFVYIRYGATSGLKVNEYKVSNTLIPDSFHGFKVVHFSDIHYGNTVDLKYLKKMVDEINLLKPDIVVFTGDFLDKGINDYDEVISILSGICASVGKYAISGESDYDYELFDSIFTSSGFINLNDSFAYVYYNSNDPIVVSGSDEEFNDIFSISLVHKPDDVLNLNNNFNIVLAGHSHGGQINLPFIKNMFLPDGAQTYYDGYYHINDTDLYVSSGIGTTDFKFRFFNKPSINLYRLTK